MGFLPPTLNELIERAPQVKKEYVKHGNPARDRIADALDVIAAFVADVNQETSGNRQEELRTFLLGAWVFCIESTDNKSLFLSPDRSKLHTKLKEKLSVSEDNLLDDKSKLEYLSQFYKFMFAEDSLLKNSRGQVLNDYLNENKLTREEVVGVIKPVFLQAMSEIVRISHGIPTEPAISEKMLALGERYKERKKNNNKRFFTWFESTNPNRFLLAQLGSATANVLATSQSEMLNEKMAYSLRVKLGMLLYVEWKINDEYWWRSAFNSNLYAEIDDILNGQGLSQLDKEVQYTCLTAFRDFLNEQNLIAIEAYGEQRFKGTSLLYPINLVADNVRKEVEARINVLSVVPSQWPVTTTMANIGALILSAPGYGIGYVLGYRVSEAVVPQPGALSLAGGAAAALVGSPAVSAGVFLPSFIVQSILTRSFATVLEAMGKLIGYTSGGLIGLTFDLSYKGLRNLCGCYLHLYNNSKLDPVLMQNIDPKFIQSILDLPEDIFNEENKTEIEQALTKHAPEKLESARPVLSC